MKHEQVVPDYILMLESSITVLALVGCGWLLFKLVSACIWFPQYMKNLELEAEKANQHLEDTLLPKKAIFNDDEDSLKKFVDDEENENSNKTLGDQSEVKERKTKKTKKTVAKTVVEKLPETETATDEDLKKEN